MSQEKPNELNKIPQTSTEAPATDTRTESATAPVETATSATQKKTDTSEIQAATDTPDSVREDNSVEGSIENQDDDNETPMPPKEPISNTAGADCHWCGLDFICLETAAIYAYGATNQ